MTPDELRQKAKELYGEDYKDHEKFIEECVGKMKKLDEIHAKVFLPDEETECESCHLTEIQKGGWAFCPWCGCKKLVRSRSS